MYTELKGRLSADKKTYFFLDEVQEINGWEKAVNSLASDYDVDIYTERKNIIQNNESKKSEWILDRKMNWIYTI